MTIKPHEKHARLSKPAGGNFHRNEIAMLGAPCGVIQKFSTNLAKTLKDLRVGYVDADHGQEGEQSPFHKIYTDKIVRHQVRFVSDHMTHEFRSLFTDTDLVLINGNHFKAAQQIVIINDAKRDSLKRKSDRLTDVLCFVRDEGVAELHDFLKTQRYADVPVCSIADLNQIAEQIRNTVDINIPALNGLVLAGGQSTRMGRDKSLINYHGKPQREYVADLIAPFCKKTYYSAQESSGESPSYPSIADSFLGLGPYGGILSAFRKNPDSAWLVVATDIPLLDTEAIRFLVENRNPSKLATCYHNPETKLPEPLITIWEPRAFLRLLSFLGNGYSCPRKVLINSDINEIVTDHPDVLANANTPVEMKRILAKING